MRRLLQALAALLALALAGCGGDDEEPGRTVTVPAGRTIPVAGDEYRFDPETIVVTGASAGTTEVRFELRNEGALAHNLRVVRAGDDLGGTPTFQGGRTRPGTVALEPGRYELVCTVGDHADLGMKGTLELRR